MNTRVIALTTALAAFGGYSLWLLFEVGYVAIWQAGIASTAAFQILADLIIACLIIGTWMITDARKRGVVVWPWIIGVFATGTIAILAYLLVRECAKKSRSVIKHQAA